MSETAFEDLNRHQNCLMSKKKIGGIVAPLLRHFDM